MYAVLFSRSKTSVNGFDRQLFDVLIFLVGKPHVGRFAKCLEIFDRFRMFSADEFARYDVGHLVVFVCFAVGNRCVLFELHGLVFVDDSFVEVKPRHQVMKQTIRLATVPNSLVVELGNGGNTGDLSKYKN